MSLPAHRSCESAGISSRGVLAFLEAADRTIRDLHSLILLREGRVVAEGYWAPYERRLPHELFSLSKSFTATAAGLAVAAGHLSLEDALVDLLPDDAPRRVSTHVAALKVRHLLTMTTGHDPASAWRMFTQSEGNWVRGFLDLPFTHAPGTHFHYENGAMFVLSAIVQHAIGTTLLDYLSHHLFDPLGIEEAHWSQGPGGIDVGFTGLRLTTDSVARFGQLYLDEGVWAGRRLLARDWVRAATSRQVATHGDPAADGAPGYGYGFWTLPDAAYHGDGAFGQICAVRPRSKIVLAITGGKEGMAAIYDLAQNHLWPAVAERPLPEDPAASRELAASLAALSIPLPVGKPQSPLAARVSGQRYTLRTEPRDASPLAFDAGHGPFDVTPRWISFDFERDGCRVTFRDDRGTHELACGHGMWRRGLSTLQSTDGQTAQQVAGAGAWTRDEVYELQWCALESAFRTTLVCRFGATDLELSWQENGSFAERTLPRLVGAIGSEG